MTIEDELKAYADTTQKFLPHVNDVIKVELPTGERWMCVHLPSRQQVEAQRARRTKDVMRAAAFGAFIYAVGFAAPALKHPGRVHNQHLIGVGILLLAVAAWLAWSKPRVKVPKEDT